MLLLWFVELDALLLIQYLVCPCQIKIEASVLTFKLILSTVRVHTMWIVCDSGLNVCSIVLTSGDESSPPIVTSLLIC